MSVRLMTVVFDSELPPTKKLLMLALSDYANDEGYHVHPAIGTLARKTSLAERTVQTQLRELEEAGLLFDTGQRTPRGVVIYALNTHKLREMGGAADAPLPRKGVQQMHPRGAADAPGGAADAPLPLEPSVNPLVNQVDLGGTWRTCQGELKLQLTHDMYELMIHPLRIDKASTTEHMVLMAPNAQVRDWCQMRLRKSIERIVRAFLPSAQIEFKVA